MYAYILWISFSFVYVFSNLIGWFGLDKYISVYLYVFCCSLSLIVGIDLATLVGLRAMTTTKEGERERKDHK